MPSLFSFISFFLHYLPQIYLLLSFFILFKHDPPYFSPQSWPSQPRENPQALGNLISTGREQVICGR